MAHHYDKVLERKDTFYFKLKRVLTGALVCIISYISIISFYQVITSYCYSYFFVDATVNYNIVDDVPVEYVFWNMKRIAFISSIGPISCLLLCVLARHFFNKYQGHINLIRYFILWFYILSLNFFLILLLSSPFGVDYYSSSLYQGLTAVFAWMHLKSPILAPVAITSSLALILFGYNTGNLFLKFSFSFKNNSVKKGRNIFITQAFTLPYIIASPFLFFLTNSFSFILNVFVFLGLILITIGMYLRNEYEVVSEKAKKSDVLNTYPVLEIIIASALWSFVFFFWS